MRRAAAVLGLAVLISAIALLVGLVCGQSTTHEAPDASAGGTTSTLRGADVSHPIILRGRANSLTAVDTDAPHLDSDRAHGVICLDSGERPAVGASVGYRRVRTSQASTVVTDSNGFAAAPPEFVGKYCTVIVEARGRAPAIERRVVHGIWHVHLESGCRVILRRPNGLPAESKGNVAFLWNGDQRQVPFGGESTVLGHYAGGDLRISRICDRDVLGRRGRFRIPQQGEILVDVEFEATATVLFDADPHASFLVQGGLGPLGQLHTSHLDPEWGLQTVRLPAGSYHFVGALETAYSVGRVEVEATQPVVRVSPAWQPGVSVHIRPPPGDEIRQASVASRLILGV